MSPLQVVVFLMVALGAVAVVRTHDPFKQAMNAGIFGMFLVAAFFVMQAPDVALSMITVEALVMPLLVLLALSKVRDRSA
jgi:uncharacterized MnhB-related membrane protein